MVVHKIAKGENWKKHNHIFKYFIIVKVRENVKISIILQIAILMKVMICHVSIITNRQNVMIINKENIYHLIMCHVFS